jgi:lipopolysaccharide/colanic/teichoic acid biosynthesis glycosyltransferase
LIDVVVSSALLVVALPVIAVVAAAVRLDTGGPVFFRCRRVGFRGTELQMLKFRKMRNGASGAALTVSGDERFTRVGRVLAKAKVDELPQLWNVLKGEMTLVGPRPEDPEFVALRPADYATILTVKPGITGLCQLAFAKEGDVLDQQDCVRDRHSLLMDLSILGWTGVAVLLRRDVAVDRRIGRLGLRRRPPREESVSIPATELGLKQ